MVCSSTTAAAQSGAAAPSANTRRMRSLHAAIFVVVLLSLSALSLATLPLISLATCSGKRRGHGQPVSTQHGAFYTRPMACPRLVSVPVLTVLLIGWNEQVSDGSHL